MCTNQSHGANSSDTSSVGPFQEQFDWIVQQIEEIRAKGNSFQTSDTPPATRPRQLEPKVHDWMFASDDWCNVISILGARGMGKTTLMAKVIRHLENEQKDIVLNPIQPERFGNDDTLLGWVLAGLKDWVEYCCYHNEVCLRNRHGKPVRAEDLDEEQIIKHTEVLRGIYMDLCRIAGRTSGNFRESLRAREADPYQFGEESARLNSDGYSLREKMHTFTNTLLDSIKIFDKDKKDALVVVPVDDADLMPKLVLSNFRDTMLLLGHRRILILLVGDLQTFTYALQNEILDPANDLPNESLLDTPLSSLVDFKNEHAKALLNKYLPKHSRVILPDLSLRERLLFTPLTERQTEKKTLLELFKQISVQPAPKQSSDTSVSVPQNTQDKMTLAHYFDLSMRKYPVICRAELSDILSVNTWIENPDLTPSLYAEMLPHKLRDIVHLHRALQQEINHENTADNTAPAPDPAIREYTVKTENQNKIIKTFWEHISQSVEVVYQERLKNAVQWRYIENRGYRLELDYTGFSSGQQVGRGRRLTVNDKTRVGIRKLNRFYITAEGSIDKSSDKTSRAKIEPSKQTQSAILFTSEFGAGGMELSDGQTDKLRTPGGASWNGTLDVIYDGRDTDNCFWIIPDWDNYLDYNLYINAWDSLVDSILTVDTNWLDNTEFVEKVIVYVYLMHLQFVLDIHEYRSTLLPQLSGKSLMSFISKQFDQVYKPWFTGITQRCINILSKYNDENGNQRYRDFINWFTLFLPWSADTLVIPKRSFKDIIRLWDNGLNILSDKNPSRKYRKEAWDTLKQRIVLNIDEPWADSLINLLRTMRDHTGVRNMRMLMERESRMTPEEALNKFTQQVNSLTNIVESEDALRLLRALSIMGPDITTLANVGAYIPQQKYERLLTLARIASKQHAQKHPSAQTTQKRASRRNILEKN